MGEGSCCGCRGKEPGKEGGAVGERVESRGMGEEAYVKG